MNFFIKEDVIILTGTQLKIKRIETKRKAGEIAAKMGIAKSYISMLENEKQNIPVHIYKKWIEVLMSDPDE